MGEGSAILFHYLKGGSPVKAPATQSRSRFLWIAMLLGSTLTLPALGQPKAARPQQAIPRAGKFV